MKIALIGTAHIHIEDFIDALNASRLEPGYVYDRDPARAARIAGRLGWRTVNEMAPEADAYIVASETHEHGEIVRALAPARKPIFVEKPLAVDPDEAALLGSMLTGGFHTGHFLHEIPGLRAIRQRLQAGDLGDLRSIDATYSHDGLKKNWFGGAPWMTDAAKAGYGGFGDMGLHCAGLLLWLTGGAAQAVKASTGRVRGIRTSVRDHFGSAALVTPDGAELTFYAGWKEAARFDAPRPPTGSLISLKVKGTEGEAMLNNARCVIRDASGRAEYFQRPAFSSGDSIMVFLHAVANGEQELLTSAGQAVDYIRLMAALYAAAEKPARAGPRDAPRGP